MDFSGSLLSGCGDMAKLICTKCGSTFAENELLWRCPECGGPLEWTDLPAFSPDGIEPEMPGLWRYLRFLPSMEGEPLTLGEGWTPLVSVPGFGEDVRFKLEFLAPTGSFKDRGVALVVNRLVRSGVREIVDDSSGNAGASMAAYSALAGISARICVPSYAPAGKKAQIAAFGADLILVDGPRPEATREAIRIADGGVFYASHAWVPINLVGQQTAAFEIWEQLGRRAPDWVIVPVGQGTLLLGLYRGFGRLLDAGVIDRMPRLVAVQSEKVSPVVKAFRSGDEDVEEVDPDYTVADGIAITNPLRGRDILRALRETGGNAIAVGEEEIVSAKVRLAHNGIFVEPTSAAPVAALEHLRDAIREGEIVVIPLTGTGLKQWRG